MTKQQDEGFSLIELLLVIVVLGILATVVVTSVGGFTADAETNACQADAHSLFNATEAFFAQRGSAMIPAADATLDGVEKTLVAEGFLRNVSRYHDLDGQGQLVDVVGSACTP